MANFTVTAQDFNSIAQTAIELIDPKGDIARIVVPSTLDPRAIAALKRVRPVATAVSSSATDTLPAGYFLVRTFSIDAADAEPMAMLEGQLGPVTKTMTSANLPDCGKIYSIAYVLRGGDWFSPSYKEETCAERRNWWPVGAAQPQSN